MSRTFLFFYLFTIPFALLADKSNPVAHFVVVFFLTFGFVGMEQVSIELDDPFGNDANDFDNSRMCATAMEDTYTNILDMDGEEWTDKLRKRLDSGIRDDDLPLEADMWLHYAVEV
jgi:predicted membrane chloride channel (bestrophin family)